MNTLKFRITGVAPWIPHNGLLADPLYEFSKRIKKVTALRKKTEADLEEMARLEFLGGLYLKDGEPCIPGEMIEAALAGKGGAARKNKSGAQAAAGLFVPNPAKLEYDGPKDPNELWKDYRFRFRVPAKVGMAKVMRTRPIFEQWSAVVEVHYNPDLVDRDRVIDWIVQAGAEVGIGDWRPRYGRFTVELL
jgi:hypothetical protein